MTASCPEWPRCGCGGLPCKRAAIEREKAIYQAAIALHAAVMKYKRACTELRRADAAGTQPRMQKAGNRHYFAELDLFRAADAFANAGETDGRT